MPIKPKQTATAGVTLPFEKFWAWLQAHANCILRAGTSDTVLFDHEDYHWHLAAEDDSTLIVQLVRGKELVGEILLSASEIAYVQCEVSDGEEYDFQCIRDSDSVAYHFTMAHEYEEVEAPSSRRWTH